MQRIDGKKIAENILARLKNLPKPEKFLAVFSVAPDAATKKFLERKKSVARELGVEFRIYEFPEAISQDNLRKEIQKIVSKNSCGGTVLQLPLPAHIDAQYVANAIPREKDPDVLGERAQGAFNAGRNPVLPPAAGTVEEILSYLNLEISGLRCAVVGLGRLVGRPVSVWFTGKCRDLSLLDKGSDFGVLENADVVVLGTGEPELVDAGMLKKNSVAIDFGYGEKNGSFCGDFSEKKDGEISFTPTPGGTGPILVAKLFENFFTLQKYQPQTKKNPSFYKG